MSVTLTVTKAGNGTGLVTSTPAGIDCGADCTEDFAAGTAVTLTATASTGARFLGWTGGGCSGTGSCSVTLSASTSVSAAFALEHTLVVTLAGAGSGTVTSSPAGIDCGADCTEIYASGTMVTLTASPAMGSTFSGWSMGCTGTGACTLTVAQATMVTATFALQQLPLTVVKSGTGDGVIASMPAGIACGAICTASFDVGTQVSLTAVADTGSTFVGWMGGGCAGTSTCVVTVTAATSVSALFSRDTYPLTVLKTGTGSGTVVSAPVGIDCGADCSEVWPYGTMVQLVAVAAGNSVFTGWSGGACTGTGTCMVTLSQMTSVTAGFDLQTFAVTVTRAGTGSGTVTSMPTGINCGADCSELWVSGSNVTLTATPATGSSFTGWSGACTGAGACNLTVTADATAVATFTLNQHALTVTRAGTGTGVVTSSPAGINCGVDCTENYGFGTVVVLTAAPSGGSSFAGWSGGGCSGTGTCTVTMNAAQSVSATFNTVALACDAFTAPNGTAVSGWTENVGDWVIDANRLRINQSGGIYSNNITMNGSSQLNGCGRLSAFHTGAAAGQVVGIVLRWQNPSNYIVAVLQDNSGSGNFNSAWIYQMPLMDIGGAITGQNFGLSPNFEACVNGNTVTMRIDANADGTYETTRTGTTTIMNAGLTGVMAKSDSASTANMPRIDNFCWGP